MNTLIVGLLALATLGGSAAIAAECVDLAGQGHACAAADPAAGTVDVEVVVEPQPPASDADAPTCQDVAGQADVCHDVTADPASGVDADVTVDVHPTPPL